MSDVDVEKNRGRRYPMQIALVTAQESGIGNSLTNSLTVAVSPTNIQNGGHEAPDRAPERSVLATCYTVGLVAPLFDRLDQTQLAGLPDRPRCRQRRGRPAGGESASCVDAHRPAQVKAHPNPPKTPQR